eukprot:10225546-Alexandrium_andersonii.AAC.1
MTAMMATCHDRHRTMMLTIMMVMARTRKQAQTWSPELSRDRFCAVVRTDREYSKENPPGALEGSFCAVARAGRRG